MQLNVQIVVAIALFIAFSIGLNLGLHGVISLHKGGQLAPKSPSSVEVIQVVVPTESIVKVTASSIKPPDVTKPPIADKIQSSESRKVAKVLSLVHNLVNTKIKESKSLQAIDSGAISSNRIPIVLLTCNRPQLLEQTLVSLLKIRGVSKDQILISQDGTMPEVASIVKKNGLTLIQNNAGLRGSDGGSRIAMHYRYSLSAAFDRNPTANAIIIVEDDLLFSPDFYEYFQNVNPIMAADPSVFVVSAWNDNGFKERVHDPYALKRTDYFPGLGWMLSRTLYKGELEQQWPREHWDHWLRSPSISKNRDIVYPEVPRTYHNGIKGTFMNLETHNKYFRDIGYNTDPSVHWTVEGGLLAADPSYTAPVYMQAEEDVYEYRTQQLIKQCKHIDKISELVKQTDEVICLWINVNPSSEWRTPEFEPVSTFFGIWHEHRRGGHKGLHEFYWEGNYVLVLNCFGDKSQTFDALKPSSVRFIEPNAFDKSLVLEMKRSRTHIDIHKSDKVGLSCDGVCSAVGKQCSLEHTQMLNSCEVMKEQFQCSVCKKSVGAEQPAYVDSHAEREFGPAHYMFCLPQSYDETVRLCLEQSQL